MKKRFELSDKAMDIAIALVLIVFVITSSLIFKNPGVETVAPSVSPFLIMIPESVTKENIDEYVGVKRTYTFDLSRASQLQSTNTLFFYLRHLISVIDIDGNVIFDTRESNDWHVGRTPGGYWVKVPISEDYADKKLNITIIPVYNSVSNSTPEFLVIDRQMLIHMIVWPKEGFLFSLGIIAGLMGFILMLLSLFLGLSHYNRRRLFFLGAISVCTGIWKLTGLSLVTLIFDYYGRQKLFWYIGIMAYTLMLLLSLHLTNTLHGKEKSIIGTISCMSGSVLTFAIWLLNLLNIVDIHEVLVPYGITIGILHILTLIKNPTRSELLWFVPSCIALLTDAFILFKTGSINGAPVLITWIILNLLIRGYGYLRTSERMEIELRSKDEELRGIKTQALINQIRPHFIFNTLASINMICDSDPKRAMELTANFNNYLQANFSAISTTEPVPFETELDHTKAYLSVENALYVDKLHVDYDTEYLDFSLPPLTLQPLVENSVKHGVGRTHKEGHISIRTRKVAGGAEILVEDDGPSISIESKDNEVHVGLKNVTERLKIMCGGKLTVGIKPGNGNIVTIFIPQ